MQGFAVCCERDLLQVAQAQLKLTFRGCPGTQAMRLDQEDAQVRVPAQQRCSTDHAGIAVKDAL